MKTRSTKKALLASLLSLVVCVSLLVGSTFAWFTDSVTSAQNVIQSGNLDVELYYQVEGQSDWTKVTPTTNVFKENALWEPGYTEVVKLKVVNEGSLALKYQLGVNIANEVGSTNVNGAAFKLSDFIKYGIVDGDQDYTRETAIAAVDATASLLNAPYKSDVTALPSKNDTDSDEKIVTMVVYMPTTVGNDANHAKGAAVPTINLGINLLATQETAEEDSFGNDYDEIVFVDTIDEMIDAIDNGKNVTLTADIDAGASNILVDNKDEITLDLAGNTLSGICQGNEASLITIANGATLNVTDTQGDGKITYAANSSATGDAIQVDGTLNLYSGTIESTGSWNIHFCVDVRPNAWGTNYEYPTVFNMYGGRINSSDAAIRLGTASDPNFANVSSTFNMYDGEIVAGWDGVFVQQSRDKWATLSANLFGGRITAPTLAPVRVYGPAFASSVSGSDKPITILVDGCELVDAPATQTWYVDGKISVGGGMTVAELDDHATVIVN